MHDQTAHNTCLRCKTSCRLAMQVLVAAARKGGHVLHAQGAAGHLAHRQSKPIICFWAVHCACRISDHFQPQKVAASRKGHIHKATHTHAYIRHSGGISNKTKHRQLASSSGCHCSQRKPLMKHCGWSHLSAADNQQQWTNCQCHKPKASSHTTNSNVFLQHTNTLMQVTWRFTQIIGS